MKLTVRAKKLIALFLMVSVVLPLTSSFGIWDSMVDSAYAIDSKTIQNASVTGSESKRKEEADSDSGSNLIASSKDSYEFNMSPDSDIYDYTNQIYRNDFKSENNLELTIDQLGTNENPYVILEISPSSAISQIRGHIGDQGLFDLSNEQVAAITLTDTDKTIIKLNAIKYFCDKNLKIIEEEFVAQGTSLDARLNELKYQAMQRYLDYIKETYSLTAEWQIRNKVGELNPGVNAWGGVDDYYKIPKVKEFVEDALGYNLGPDVIATVNGRGAKSIEDTLDELEDTLIEAKIVSEETFTAYLQERYDYALQYKINCRKSEIYYSTIVKGYGFNYNYITQYAVSDGKFVINYPTGSAAGSSTNISEGTFSSDGTTKKRLDLTDGGDANAIYGEYALSTKINNPIGITKNALGGIGSGIGLYTADYSFAKSCLDLGYNTVINNGEIVSQSPYVDEYIFAGWYILVDGTLERIENTLTDEFKERYPTFSFADVTDLYTNWSVRMYETDTYKQLLTDPAAGENVKITLAGADSYTIHLPGEIASANSGELHDPRNQVTMCLPDSMKAVVTWNKDFTQCEEESIDFVREISAWDFDFSRKEYNTVEKLQQVAPKLMSDTDYYVRTFNAELSVDGKVHYSPYNVKVITLSPEDLNAMVYYDYASNGRSLDSGYYESEYINTFLNNVDFVILFNGGQSIYLDKTNDVFTEHDLNYHSVVQGTALIPNQRRVPSLFTFNGTADSYEYDKSTIRTNATFGSSGNVSDIEWQVIYKMYTRLMDTTQKRRIAMITDESLTDSIAGLSGAAATVKKSPQDSEGGGSENNLCKFLHLLYAFVDPTIPYDFYANPEYKEYNFDKMRGSKRSEEYRNTHFTGVLYECECWNPALFFPYEIFGENHYDAATSTTIFAKYSPFNAGSIGQYAYPDLRLASYPNYKGIANPFAYTFNGGMSVTTELYKYYIEEVSNVTNQQGSGSVNGYTNTSLAFDYFRNIPGRSTEIKDGKLATKSAIEFMVQNVRYGIISYKDRKITILNKVNPQKKFRTPEGIVLVDRVVADDFGARTAEIEYKFTGSTSGYFVVEYYWTKQYRLLDEDNRLGKLLRDMYIKKQDTDDAKWYEVPKQCNGGAGAGADEFLTRKIVYTAGSEEEGTIKSYDDNHDLNNRNHILKWYNNEDGRNEYSVNALIKPSVKTSSDEATYIISVMQFSDAEAYKSYLNNGDTSKILTVTLKNVTIDKMKHLFSLD